MIFDRLLSLYNKHKNNDKTPLEDFTTEILVGILENDNELLDLYVNEVLKIGGEGYQIKSQVKYKLEDEKDCIIDIVIENNNYICFIENKVNSLEGDKQLYRYTKLLQILEKRYNKKVSLRYCTKQYDPKENKYIDFMQFRWNDVYKFLEDYSEDRVIESFLEFLGGQGMASAGEFNYEDLIVMNKINSTIDKMNECLDNLKPIMVEKFGKPYERDYERIKQIAINKEYTMWTKDVVCKSDSCVSIGFIFNDNLDTTTPFLCLDLYIYHSNIKFDEVKSLSSELKEVFDIDNSNNEDIILSFEKPLSDFISSENQIETICNWFEDKMSIVEGLLNKINEKTTL